MKRITMALLGLLAMYVSICFSQSLPIKPARTISFTTDEGSYMDADISPDGKTIVFDILGDLYTVPATGGNATQLTRGLAWNRYPVWSPDGKQIAFISDESGANRLEVIGANGRDERALDLAQPELIKPNKGYEIQAMPAWTPDERYVASGGQLYALAGGSMTLPYGIKYNVQFSKDNRFLYSDQDGKKIEYVERYDRQTGAKIQLAEILRSIPPSSMLIEGWKENQMISPDGNWLAYIDGSRDPVSDLRIHNLVTGEDHLFVAAVEGHHRPFVEHFAFTPDSKSLIIGYKGKLHRIDIENGTDQIIPFHAKVNADLGAFDYHHFRITEDSMQVRMTHSANASPDGKTLVFSALDRIYTMRIPDGIPHVLVKQSFGQFQPVYSPDGKWIAYVSWSDTKGGYVWRIPASGGKPEKLDNLQGYYQYPTWSHDDKSLAVVRDTTPADASSGSYAGRLGELRLIDVISKTSRKIADSAASWRSSISFSQDGGVVIAATGYSIYKPHPFRLAIFNLKDGHRQVFVIRDEKEVVNTGFLGIQQISVSPDLRYIIYGINEDLYLAPLPDIGTSAVINSPNGIKPMIRFAIGGYDPHWEQGGEMLSWSYGNHYYRIDPDKIMRAAMLAAKDSVAAGLPNNGFYRLNVVPDQSITIDLRAATQYGNGTIAFRNARIITMKGKQVIEHGTIVITDGRIKTVGAIDTISIPGKAKVYDLRGKTIMPGMIDLHDHIGSVMSIFPQQNWHYLVNLAYGVTTARNPASSFDEFAASELLQTGRMIGPRLFSVGYAVGEGFISINNVADAIATANKRKKLGATVVKQYQQETRQQRQWVLKGSEQVGLNMTNEGDYDPKAELAMIKDGSTGVEHAYGWGNVYNDVIRFIAESRTWHTPTLQVASGGQTAEPYFRNYYREHHDTKLSKFWPADGYPSYSDLMQKPWPTADTVKSDFEYTSSIEAKIYRQGGHIGLGGHGDDPGVISQWELWALQMGGLTNLEALKVATISGAEALGMQQDLGSIELGKIADLLILDKNPLDDIHNTLSIRYVMKSGILYNGDNLDELWPEHKKCPEWKLDKKYLTNKDKR